MSDQTLLIPETPPKSFDHSPALDAELIFDAEVFEPSLPSKFWNGVASALQAVFGVVALVFGLAILATIPIAQFWSLGYLLEASGRVASTGKLRNGFIGVRLAAQLGSIALGSWAMLWPLRIVSDRWYASYLIDPYSTETARTKFVLVVLTVVMVGHTVMAWYSGGKLRHFFWPVLAPFMLAMWIMRSIVASRLLRPIVAPVVGAISPRLLAEITYVPRLSAWFPPAILISGIRRGHFFAEARDAVWDFFSQIEFRHYLSLGFRGFVGALIWVTVPVLLLIASLKVNELRLHPGLGVIPGFIGAMLLGWVMFHLPFLQTNFAMENRFSAMFDRKMVHEMFRHAPIAFWFGLFITLLFSVPLYLLKIEATPREVAWLPSLFFVAFIYPARLLTGWAVARANSRPERRHWFFRSLATLVALPIVFWYVVIVYLTQFTSWHGAFSLFEQHAFMLPIPFLGL